MRCLFTILTLAVAVICHCQVLYVPRIDVGEMPDASQVQQLLDSAGVESHRIDCVNWPQYGYVPYVSFKIAHTGSAILLMYEVDEQDVRGLVTDDNGRVYTDSCVEFFVQPDSDDTTYYNIEANCVGTVLLQGGKPGTERRLADEAALGLLSRWTSLGRGPLPNTGSPATWQLALVIPAEVFFPTDNQQYFSGRVMLGNFYKCGDKLVQPHYCSWAPVRTIRPMFHHTESFAEIRFE